MDSIREPRRTFDALHQPFTTPMEAFGRNPALFLAFYMYRNQPPMTFAPAHKSSSNIKIICISDTHSTRPNIPDGDILLHAGDLTNNGTFLELQDQLHWLNALPHAHKVVIAGNHDLLLDAEFVRKFPGRVEERVGATAADLEWGDIKYLKDSSTTVTIHGRPVKIFGAPRTRGFGAWAFQYPPMEDIWQSKLLVNFAHVAQRGQHPHLQGSWFLV